VKHSGKNLYLLLFFVGLGIFCISRFLSAPKFAGAALQTPEFYYCQNEKMYLNVSTGEN
jgi:hypothetical protein